MLVATTSNTTSNSETEACWERPKSSSTLMFNNNHSSRSPRKPQHWDSCHHRQIPPLRIPRPLYPQPFFTRRRRLNLTCCKKQMKGDMVVGIESSHYECSSRREGIPSCFTPHASSNIFCRVICRVCLDCPLLGSRRNAQQVVAAATYLTLPLQEKSQWAMHDNTVKKF